MPDEFAALLSSPPGSDADVAAGMAALAPAYVRRAEPERLRGLMADTVFSASAMRRGFEVLSTWSSVDRLGSITAPTLVVAGRHDPFSSWPQADRIAAHVPGAEVVVFEESSHFPWLDEPEAFTTTIRQWLERHRLL
jgi:proline iminopeptidase